MRLPSSSGVCSLLMIVSADGKLNGVALWFVEWCRALPNKEKRVLTFDQLGAHKDDKLISVASEYNVVLLPLVRNLTYMQQPLDVGCFKSLKSSWRGIVVLYSELNPAKKSIYQKDWATNIIDLLDSAVGMKVNVRRSFLRTGIFPFCAR